MILRFCTILVGVISITLSFVNGVVVAADGVANVPNILQPRDTCPGVYDFGLGTVRVVHTRSIKKDSVYIAASLVVNDSSRITSYNITKFYGKHKGDRFKANILFNDVPIADNATAVIGYVMYNLAHGNKTDNFNKLQKTAYTIGLNVTKKATSEPGTPPDEIAFAVVGELGSLGGLISDIASYVQAGKHGCDGFLGAGIHGFKGSGICDKPATDANNLTGTDYLKGSKGSTLVGLVCGYHTPKYHVGWFTGSSKGLGNLSLVESLNEGGFARVGWLGMVVVLGAIGFALA